MAPLVTESSGDKSWSQAVGDEFFCRRVSVSRNLEDIPFQPCVCVADWCAAWFGVTGISDSLVTS